MAVSFRILPHYTYDDYVHWEGQWELIEGIPFSKKLELTPAHQLANTNLGAEFYVALKSFKHCNAYPSIAYKIQENMVFQPDLLITSKPIEKYFLDFPPCLITEVLSPERATIDRHTKYHAYQEQGISHYLIVSPETEETEVYILEQGEYVLKQKAISFIYTFHFGEGCEATIDFAEIWK